MKYEYKYEFATDSETIKVSKRWHRILKDFDRYENAQDRRQRYHCWRVDLLKYESIFYGKNDEYFDNVFFTSQAFDYAVEHMPPRYKDILCRRVLNYEKFESIGKTYNLSPMSACVLFHRVVVAFRKHYTNGLFLYSKENQSQPIKDRITVIPAGLTPEQVLEIRRLRYEYKSIREISSALGIGEVRVSQCLHGNPVIETLCPNCNTPVKQSAYGKMKIFCCRKCSENWHKVNFGTGMKQNKMGRPQIELSDWQRVAADYYRQIHLPQIAVQDILNLSETVLMKYYHANPPPHTFCNNCGVKIPGIKGKRSPMYCSDKCRFKHKEITRKNIRNNITVEPKFIPTPEQIKQAVEIKRNTQKGYKRISNITGIPIQDLELMFMFE